MSKAGKCHQHPNYRGVGTPSANCNICAGLWYANQVSFEEMDNVLDDNFDLKDFMLKYQGTDRLVGRPIRLNKVVMELKKGKDYAQLMFFGDMHLGYPECRVEKALEYLGWARRNGVYVVGMGDYLECGTTTSIGDSVYHQRLNPDKQAEVMTELFRPLADAGLLIGIHSGNHEDRIQKMTSIDLTKRMARDLKVPYLSAACWNMLSVGKQKYSMYTWHGKSGARFKHTKMKAAMDPVAWLSADIIAMGHVHSIGAEPCFRQVVDFRNKQVKEEKCHVFITGSYISWDKSYAQGAGLPITAIGSPTAKLFANTHNIAGSV